MKKGKKREKKKMKAIKLYEYLMLVSMIFLLSGIMLFLYCIISNINLGNLVWFNDPLFFFGVGITIFICFIGQRLWGVFDKIEKVIDNE